MADPILSKTCRCCKEEKPLDAFTRLCTNPEDGRDKYCRACQAKKRRRRLVEGPRPVGRPQIQAALPFDNLTDGDAKFCAKCGVHRPLSDFTSEAGRRDGRRNYCRACMKTYLSNWRRSNPEKYNEIHRQWRARNVFKNWLSQIRVRCRTRGIPYDLHDHFDELRVRWDAGRCEMSGVPFNLKGKRLADSPSFDRIDPAKGYVYGNVRIVCLALNTGMNNWGEEKFREIVAAWLARRDDEAMELAGVCG